MSPLMIINVSDILYVQAMETLRKIDETITRPNPGSATRWGGMIDIYIWIGKHWETLDKHYIDPADCVENDDGTR